MGAIIDFFKGLADFISGVVDFVVTLFEDLVWTLTTLLDLLPKIGTSLNSFLPPTIIALVSAILVVVVIYKVSGREG